MHRVFLLTTTVLALVACVSLTSAATIEPPAQVAVSPSRFELPIGEKPTTEALTLFNYGDEEVEISAGKSREDLGVSALAPRFVGIEATHPSRRETPTNGIFELLCPVADFVQLG